MLIGQKLNTRFGQMHFVITNIVQMLLQTWVCYMKQENGGMNNHWNIEEMEIKNQEVSYNR